MTPHRQYSFRCGLQGGTAAAPEFLNDRNQGHPATYLNSTADCHYLVMLESITGQPLKNCLRSSEFHKLLAAGSMQRLIFCANCNSLAACQRLKSQLPSLVFRLLLWLLGR